MSISTTTIKTIDLQIITLTTSKPEPRFIKPQLQSPFFRLPPELRNQITTLCLNSSSPILNPAQPSQSADRPNLGVPLLRTCRLQYLTTSLHPLYTTPLIFTLPSELRSFLSALAPSHRALLAPNLHISLSSIANPHVPASDAAYREWLHYLTVSATASLHTMPGSWYAGLSVLSTDFPTLQSLTVDLDGWTRNPGDVDERWRYPAIETLITLLGYFSKNGEHGEGLREVSVLGSGSDFWGLGNVTRPGPLPGMEWCCLERWIEAVGVKLVKVLVRAVGSACVEDEGRAWVGWVWKAGCFRLVARRDGGKSKRMVLEEGEQMCSWDECLKMTQNKQARANPTRLLLDF